MEETTPKEFARLPEIPVFRAGTHQDADRSTYAEAELDEIIEMSNAAQALIQASIAAGKYPDGNQIALSKPIPGVINLHHQKYLSDTLKEAVKGASVKFSKRVIDGVNWICATFENVKQDVAEFLQAKFPFRSVEILPELTDPATGQTFRNVIRSVGFLDPDTLPAVSGQSPLLPIEFEAGTPIKTVVCCINNPITTTRNSEVKSMPEEIKKDEGVQTPPAFPAINVAEFEALQTKTKTFEAKVAEMEAANQSLASALKVERDAREKAEMREFCAALTRDFGMSPAGLKVIAPLLEKADNITVKEFAADLKTTDRQALMSAVKELAGMAKAGNLLVFEGEVAPQKTDPAAKPDPEVEKLMKIAEFFEPAKAKAKNPDDEKEVWSIAYSMAIDKYGDAL